MGIWGQVIELYERDQRRRGLAAESIKTRGRILRQLSRHCPDPWAVTGELLDDWLDDPAKAMDTRRCYLSGVAGFYRWAIRYGHTTTNPVDRVERPKRKRRLPRPIHTDHFRRSVKQADPMMRCWLLLGARAGLRCMEIAGLDRGDVLDHLDEPMLWIRHGKGDKERTVPLHPEILRALQDYGMPRHGVLFPADCGGRRTPQSVSKHINKYLRRLGLSETAHQYRHLFGTDVYRVSRDLRLTQELLGHSSPDVTAGYAAWSPNEATGVVRQLSV